MKNKQTATEFLLDNIHLLNSLKWNEVIEQAKQMEKEQMIEFADKVLDNTCGGFILLYPIEEIYNKTYNQPNNEQ
jgi:hypothetical protein